MELVAWIRLQATGCIEEISHFTTSEFKDPQGCTSAAAVGDLAMKMTLTAGQKDALQTQTLKIPYCGSGPSTQHGSLAEHRLTIWSKLFQTWHRHILHSARPSELLPSKFHTLIRSSPSAASDLSRSPSQPAHVVHGRTSTVKCPIFAPLVHTHTCLHACMHTYIHAFIHACVHTCTHE